MIIYNNKINKKMKNMKHLQTFENFINKKSGSLQERAWFTNVPYDTSGDYDDAFAHFFNNAKVGDTFYFNPEGTDLLSVPKGKETAARLRPEETSFGADYTGGSAKGVLCQVVARRVVRLLGTDYPGEVDTVFFTMEGDTDTVFLFPEIDE